MGRRRGTANSVSFFAFQDIITSVVGIFVLITLIMMLELAQSTAETTRYDTETISREMFDSLAKLESKVAELSDTYTKLQSGATRAASSNRFTREEESKNLAEQLRDLQGHKQLATQTISEIQAQIANARRIEDRLLKNEKALKTTRERTKALEERRKATERFAAILEIDKPLIFRERTQEGRFLVLVRLEKTTLFVSDAETGQEHSFVGSKRINQFRNWLENTDLSSRQILLIVKPSGEGDFEQVLEQLQSHSATFGFDVAGENANFKLRSQLELP